MKRRFLAQAGLVMAALLATSISASAAAQEFQRLPGLSPQQQTLIDPIRTPPLAAPVQTVPSIAPPAPTNSTNPVLTQYPPSSGPPSSSIDRRDTRKPGARMPQPSPQDRSKAPPNELTAPPADLMTRPGATTSTNPATQPSATPPIVTPNPAPAPRFIDPNGINWQTVTLPPPPDFTRPNSASPLPPPRPEGQGVTGGGTGSEQAARRLIEADGYRNVTGLAPAPGGGWQGRAMRGNAEVGVRVDNRGNVSAE